MGVFPHNYEISLSELFKLWVAEKFLTQRVDRLGVCTVVKELYHNSLLLQRRHRSSSIHSSFWYLCRREALKNKFSYVIECRADSLLEDIKDQRRLCVHKNILFGIKDVHKSMASISIARSLLCNGPPHQYPVPICFNLRLLRILNALTIRLYEFPMDVLKLFQLKYLSLTCYENLPSSISRLWNLEILIVGRHLSIGSSRAPSYLPVEIWDMKELKHLQVMGSDLPDPCEGIPNLQTLLDVSARSCNKCVFSRNS
ncbi:putative late blight resistance protein homolog r1b-14 [Phtheirospermum japonicum]|uniref:Putative late blight resistance protein homolog r1b-14 n=1 Tax=Phtheirospermum japonicum TaxID=374723 RepID=A0A830BHE8_9LAMI|nr:putative late blight resistance protein homolog r1b-14 [Phtheirospermum japonicum]